MFALTAIKGVGRRYANIVLKKADVDLDKRAGECTDEEVEKVLTIMSNPRQYKIPDWFLNRQKDIVDGKYNQVRRHLSSFYEVAQIKRQVVLVVRERFAGSLCNIIVNRFLNCAYTLSCIVERSLM